MSHFITKLWLEHVDGDNWIVCSDFKYYSDGPITYFGDGILIVPAGSTTDLASIPWLFRRILPKSGKYNPAAVLHDAGYNGYLKTNYGQSINLIKPYCDQLFLEAMEVAGVNGRTRKMMYEAVKHFGKPKTQVRNIIG